MDGMVLKNSNSLSELGRLWIWNNLTNAARLTFPSSVTGLQLGFFVGMQRTICSAV